MQPGYKTPPAKESGKLALSRNNSPFPLFCQSSNVRSSHNVCNDNDNEGRSLCQEFLQENLIVSPDNNDNGEGTGSSSIRGEKCRNLAIASNNTTPPVAVGVGSMSALIYQLAELEKERSSNWNGNGNGNVREMERLSNEFNEQADVLVAVLQFQLSLNSSTSKNNAQAVSEPDSNSNSDIGDVASIDIKNPSSDDPDKDKDKAASSNVDISSKTSGLIFQLAETELAKSKARDIGEIESLKKTFKRQAEAFISAFSGSGGKGQR